MKIALLTLGTRGDVQPFAVLGKALQERGHDITLATARNFESFINSYSLKFQPVDADFQQILNSEEGKKMMSNPFSARKHLNRLIYPMIEDALNTFYKISNQHDCVLFHVKAMADYFADGTNAILIRTNVVPAIEPTREFINPIISFSGLPKIFNRFSYKFSDWGMKMMSKPIFQFRKHWGLNGKVSKENLLSLYGISPHYLPQPKDFPSTTHFTGFWLDRSEKELEPALVEFLQAGAPPLLLTLGSMPFESKLDLASTLKEMVEELKIRLIVVRGWGLTDTPELENNKDIRVIHSAPYEKLFPLVKAVIQHGGIGTIAACLKAGKPFMTCPVLYPLGDQHFWGMIGFKQGVSIKPIPLKKLTKEKLFNSVKELLSNDSLYENSIKMREKLKDEDGVGNAIRLIEEKMSFKKFS